MQAWYAKTIARRNYPNLDPSCGLDQLGEGTAEGEGVADGLGLELGLGLPFGAELGLGDGSDWAG